MVRLLFGALGAIALAVVATECHEGAGWLSSRIVLLAAKRLPERLRAICQEGWLAELEAFEGLRLLKLLWSVGFYVAAIKLGFRYRSEIKAERGHNGLVDLASPELSFVLRRHPAILAPAGLPMVLALTLAIGVSVPGSTTASSSLIWRCWLYWGLTFLWLLWKMICWSVNYFAVSPSEFVWQWGLIRQRAARIPIADVQRVEMRRSLFGRIFDYGTLIIRTQYPCTPCGSRTHRRTVPHPQRIMLEIVELLEASPTPFVIAD